MTAVMVPLEVALRAQLGQAVGNQVMTAVIEALEVALRSQLGQVRI